MTTVRVFTKQGIINEVVTVNAVEVSEVVRQARKLVALRVSPSRRWMIPFTSVELIDA